MEKVLNKEIKELHLTFGRWSKGRLRPIFLTALREILFSGRHEGRIIPKGALFADGFSESEGVRVSRIGVQSNLIQDVPNGSTCFAYYDRAGFVGLAFTPDLSDELEAVRFRYGCKGLIIQKDSAGITKVIHESGITIHHDRVWWLKRSVINVLDQVRMHVPQVGVHLLRNILEFAFHHLSPRHIGATLVLYLTESGDDLESMRSADSVNLRDLSLNITDRTVTSVISDILARNDGATIIGPNGAILGVGSHLRYSSRSEDLVSQHKGTRHTSARRFSFDEPRTVVVTVSEDGPVTVFSDGIDIATLEEIGFDALSSAVSQTVRLGDADLANAITNMAVRRRCENCGKMSEILEIVVPLYREDEEAYCPLCHTQIYSAHCWRLEARIVKDI
jgi:DNA integrity scanning protein DisA with diadenylate cyclase activity